MQIFKLAQCPYCGRKIGLLRCWILKTQGEYRCPKCGGYSNIVLHPALIIFAMIAILISTAVFLIQILLIRTFSWLILVLVFLPFLLFFLSSVFLVQFKKPASRKRPPEERNGLRIEPPETQNRGHRIEPPSERDRRGFQSQPPGARNRDGGERTIVMNYTRKL